MAKTESMNVFDFAIQMEQDGEKFYRDLAAKSEDKGVKSILNGLADDEVKHGMILNSFKKGASPEMARTTILGKAKNVFAGMAARKAFAAVGVDQLGLYQQALEIERKSRELYKAQADGSKLKAVRDLFLRLSDEENRHFFLLEHMIEFVTQPQRWLENAEFNHLEDY
jgi:rubrerythrin